MSSNDYYTEDKVKTSLTFPRTFRYVHTNKFPINEETIVEVYLKNNAIAYSGVFTFQNEHCIKLDVIPESEPGYDKLLENLENSIIGKPMLISVDEILLIVIVKEK